MTNYDSLNSGKRADALEKALLLSVEHYFKTFDCCDICPLGVIDCDDERGEMIYPDDTYGVKCAGGDVKKCKAALVEYWKRKATDDDGQEVKK